MNTQNNSVATKKEAECLMFSPSTDIYTEGDHLVVESEMPGLEKSQIEVQLENRVLSLKALGGKKKIGRTGKECQVGYERRFHLNNSFNGEDIKAEYHDGILKITIPKSEAEKTKKVAIA